MDKQVNGLLPAARKNRTYKLMNLRGLWNEGTSCTNMSPGMNKQIGSLFYSTMSPLDPNGSYTYTIQLQNACGVSSCATRSFTTGPPPNNCQMSPLARGLSDSSFLTDQNLFDIFSSDGKNFKVNLSPSINRLNGFTLCIIYNTLGKVVKVIRLQPGENLEFFAIVGLG
ncbi:MAG: hypothetical protein H0W62_15205 [Chitinophagales bacterium]|nr:hypothetical protein [Chitinophagales bacterium]